MHIHMYAAEYGSTQLMHISRLPISLKCKREMVEKSNQYTAHIHKSMCIVYSGSIYEYMVSACTLQQTKRCEVLNYSATTSHRRKDKFCSRTVSTTRHLLSMCQHSILARVHHYYHEHVQKPSTIGTSHGHLHDDARFSTHQAIAWLRSGMPVQALQQLPSMLQSADRCHTSDKCSSSRIRLSRLQSLQKTMSHHHVIRK